MDCSTTCFDNLIGLRDVCEPATIQSCYWINDIGISRFTLEQIITKDYSDPSDFFLKQYDFTVNQVTAQIHSKFGTLYKVNSVIEGMRLGFLQDNKGLKLTNSKWAGIYIELFNTNSYLDFYQSEIVLTTDFNGVIPIKVYDVLQGKLLKTINLTSVAGQQSALNIAEIFKSSRRLMKLFICYDTTGINSYKTLIKNSSCNTCSNCTYSNQYIKANGAYSNANTFLLNDLTSTDHTFGMSLVYSLQCNHKDWLCSHLNILALPIMYKLASNILLFGLKGSADQRTNTKVTINKDKMAADQAYNENQFQQSLANILLNMQVPSDTKCFQCRTPYRTQVVLP